MTTENTHVGVSFNSSLFLFALFLGMFLLGSGLAFTSTLLPDIASTFRVSIGTAGLQSLVVNVVGLVVGLLMGALTIRFKHKSLFLLGIAVLIVGELILFFAPNFASALLGTFFAGMGRAVIPITILALIGGLLPLEKRGWAIGLTVSATFIALVVVPFISVSIAHMAGWRSVLLWFMLPFAVSASIVGLLFIPSKPHSEKPGAGSVYLEAFKAILLNKSAIACFVGTMFFAVTSTIAVYAVSFYRIDFSLPQVTAGLFASVAAAGGALGGAFGGRLVNRIGRKPLTVVAVFISGLSVLSFTYMSSALFSLAIWAVSAATAAIGWVGIRSLTLEQVPRFRGSMMSIYQTFEFLGAIIGGTTGTLVLNLYANNFQLLMTILGAYGLVSAPVLLLLARDPIKIKTAT